MTVNVCVNDTCMYVTPHLHTKICFILYNTLEPDLSLRRLLEVSIQEVYVSLFRAFMNFVLIYLNSYECFLMLAIHVHSMHHAIH